MKLPLLSLLLAATVSIAACDGDTGAMGVAGSAGPAGPAGAAGSAGAAGPVGSPAAAAELDLAALARSGMSEPEYASPREVNQLNVVGTENPSEFDDLFQ